MADLEKQERVFGEEEDKFLEEVTLLDFDMLCSTVAMQTQGKWAKLDSAEDAKTGPEIGGVFRMWEGELLDCFEDRRIAIESAWLDSLIHFFFSLFTLFREIISSFCSSLFRCLKKLINSSYAHFLLMDAEYLYLVVVI